MGISVQQQILIVLVAIVVVCLGGWVTWSACNNNNLTTSSYRNTTASGTPSKQRWFRFSRADLSRDSDGMPPVAPLWWDDEEGAYMVQLRIGHSVVELVLDSGSGHISAKGDKCTWNMCELGPDGVETCTMRECGCGTNPDGSPKTECSAGRYRPSTPEIAPGTDGAGNYTTLAFGSQEDHLTHHRDKVAMKRIKLRCTDVECHPITGGHESNITGGSGVRAAGNEMHHVDLGHVMVHHVYHSEGSSNSNILGISKPPPRGGHSSRHSGPPVVLSTLFENHPPVWSMLLHERTGWWILGKLPSVRNLTYIPMLDPPEFKAFTTHFYIVPLAGVAVGKSKETLRPLRGLPRYVVLDTGTTYTYGSTEFGRVLQRAKWNESSDWLQITLGTGKNSVPLTFSPEQHRDPDDPNQRLSVLNVTEGRTLPEFDEIFGSVGGVLLLGATLMRDAYWEYDIAQNRIGVNRWG